MKPLISVIVCTHNPRFNYLARVLEALKLQRLPIEKWELLLIDNASSEPLEQLIDLSWHCHSRHIREEKLGLTVARLRGVKEANGELLVFVDDDNVLEFDYLEKVLQIGESFPLLGAWSGQVLPEFEEQPPEWTIPYLARLVIREVDQDKWSNLIHQEETTPYGAGLCIRKTVANKYTEIVQKDLRRTALGRTGKVLSAGEDVDIAYTACDIGLGTGVFKALKLTHLIPPNRLKEEYLLKLTEGIAYSGVILESFRGRIPPRYSWKAKLLHYFRSWFLTPRERRFKKAYFRGLELGTKKFQNKLK